MTRFIPAVLVNFEGDPASVAGRRGRGGGGRRGGGRRRQREDRQREEEPAEEEADVAGPSSAERKIRLKLRHARAVKRRIGNLNEKHPLGWKVLLRKARSHLRRVIADLKALGWTPAKPTRPRKPGEDPEDAVLDEIPAAEPRETEEPDGEFDVPEPAEIPETEGDENWLDAYVGVEPRLVVAPQVKAKGAALAPVGKFIQSAAQRVKQGATNLVGWRRFDHLGINARIQTRTGQSAMITTVNPGLFIVQIVSDEAARKIAGDNIGVLPLLLYPMVKNQIQKLVAPKHAPAAAPGAPAAPVAPPADVPAPEASGLGCDCRPRR